MTERERLLANNRFLMTVGPVLLSFARITNISHALETEQIQEGGCNWAPEVLIKPASRAETIVLERGIQTGAASVAAEKLLGLGNYILAATIMVMGPGGTVSKVYGFEEGMVTKWEVGGLDAMGKDILIRKLEISHSGLYEV